MRHLPHCGMLVALYAATPLAQATEPTWTLDDLHGYLNLAEASLTQKDWKEAAEGGVAAKMLASNNNHEVVVVGLIRVKADTACFLTRFEDIENFKKGPAVITVRKIGTRPGTADLSALRLAAGEVAGLKMCRESECGLKLPVEAMNRIAAQVKWDAPNAHELAETAFRGWLADYLRAYGERGNAGLVEYGSGRVPVRLGSQFQELPRLDPGVLQVFGELPRGARRRGARVSVLVQRGSWLQAHDQRHAREYSSGARESRDRIEADLCQPLLRRFSGIDVPGGRPSRWQGSSCPGVPSFRTMSTSSSQLSARDLDGNRDPTARKPEHQHAGVVRILRE